MPPGYHRKKKIYSEILYDLKYKLVADYDFFLKCLKNGKSFYHLEYCMIDYDLNGQSAKNMVRAYKEIYKVKGDHHLNRKSSKAKISYLMGIGKRKILEILPDWIRWPCVNFIHDVRDKYRLLRRYLPGDAAFGDDD